jgi:hypothetical protein
VLKWVLSVNLIASNFGVFFSAQVKLQSQATAGHSIIFGDFPEMNAPGAHLPPPHHLRQKAPRVPDLI